MFYVGQKVVAVGGGCDTGKSRKLPVIPIGTICVVREYDARAVGLPGHETACLRLMGIYGPIQRGTFVGDWEAGYQSCCFRPLTERKNDGEAFVRMLKDNCIQKTLEDV